MDEPRNEEPVDETDLFEYFQIVWQRKWGGLLIINCVVIATLIHTLWLADEVYEAQATIMPLKSSSGSRMSALTNFVPGGLPFSMSPGEENLNRFVNILQSRTLAEAVVRHLDLMHELYRDVPPQERPTFQRVVKHVKSDLVQATDNKKGLVQFSAQADSPQLAADIANAYVQHLQRYLKENIATESERNRIFIEGQHQQAVQDLEQAERQLQAFKEQHRLFSLSAQTADLMTRLGTLKGNLMAKQADLNVRKRSGVAENNPQYKTLTYEIEVIKQQITELEEGTRDTVESESVALEALPELERELARLMREKAVQETLYQLLGQQYEEAKIAEASAEISFLTLDSAIPPLLRVKPNRMLNLLLGGMLGVMFAFAYVMLQTVVEKYRNRQEEEKG
ncbi:MAG: Wzz/FepE/Etk N-terminal domain-containing protein [Candidatus Poribacteria bacterium]|nr:Wzz/FepE/Etk N-terminal domain-containing protein [Candidatus Poribacteria bacterium]